MRRIGFETLRLGVETADFGSSRRLDRKLGREDFFRAVLHLRAAGFAGRQVGAYLLAGLPGQTWKEVARSIESVRASGITPVIAHYTPIPHTALWEEARQSSRYDLAADPVFTNNAITPCQHTEFSWEELSRLKALAGR
jgi:radical SAM superfamily enzyme